MKTNAVVRGVVYVVVLGGVEYDVGRTGHPGLPKFTCRVVTDAVSWILDESVDAAATNDLPHPALANFMARAGEKVP